VFEIERQEALDRTRFRKGYWADARPSRNEWRNIPYVNDLETR